MSNANYIVTQQLLKDRLSYDCDTGLFTWKKMNGPCRISVGDVAGSLHANGYIVIRLFSDTAFPAHRLAWLYMTGEMPKEFIDHINGIRHDNRWRNLREANYSLNAQNQKLPSRNNAAGFLGVCYSPRHKKFSASIHHGGKKHWLGYHKTADLAHEAYLVAKRNLHVGCTI